MRTRIRADEERLGEFCRRHGIRRLSLFGSVLRDDFGPDSDVDVVVEFETGHVPGLIRFGQMEEERAGVFGGRRLDLVTPKFLSPRTRERVMAEAEVQFAAG